MKKIIIIVVCAGMSVGLLIGNAGSTRAGAISKAETPAQRSTAATRSVTLCSLDEVITNRTLSLSLNGLQGNHKFKALQAEINSLKTELSKTEKGTKEYDEKISALHSIWGKISVLLGEINATVDAETETLSQMSQDNANIMQSDYEFKNILYMAETE